MYIDGFVGFCIVCLICPNFLENLVKFIVYTISAPFFIVLKVFEMIGKIGVKAGLFK